MSDFTNKMLSISTRPFSLDKIIGQKFIEEFKNRSLIKNFSQVMFFIGESGSGKSTLGLTIAGLLNCEKPVLKKDNNKEFYDPCGQCKSCKDIINGKFQMDVVYIDADSKNDIVEIERLVNHSPLYSKNRIIIVDEAQRLSSQAKSKTLKLLEDQRNNVYFILCSMDKNAFDNSILARGQLYIFKKISIDETARYLFNILKQENFNFPDSFLKEGCLHLLADKAEGNIRMAIQYLERCLYGNLFTIEDIEKGLDIINEEKIFNLLLKLLDKDTHFFVELDSVNIEEFFYCSWGVLVNAQKYRIINEELDRSKVYYNKIIGSPTFEELFDIFIKLYLDLRYRFNDKYFYAYLFKFYKNENKRRIVS